MIDYKRLDYCYKNDLIYSLQLEVGDLCYQGCIYCYMNALDEERNTLSDNQIKKILLESKELGITAIEWLGGEPLLRRSIFMHMETAQELGFRNNVWTGGLPLGDKQILKKTIRYTNKGLIAIHVSSINPKIYKKLHPDRPKNDLNIILSSIKNL